jgi:hypothetical protein
MTPTNIIPPANPGPVWKEIGEITRLDALCTVGNEDAGKMGSHRKP